LAARTPTEAVEDFLTRLRPCLARVTNEQLQLSPRSHEVTQEPHSATLGRGQITKLRGDRRLGLTIGFQYRVVRTKEAGRKLWRVSMLGYAHSITDEYGAEIVTFHWQPAGRIDFPHVHIGTIALNDGGLFDRRAHIPTGRVIVEQVLRFAIEEFGVDASDGWQQVFTEAQAYYEESRTWS
jgi:hypothetical protein